MKMLRREKYNLSDFLVTKKEPSVYNKDKMTEVIYYKCPRCGCEVKKPNNNIDKHTCKICALVSNLNYNTLEIYGPEWNPNDSIPSIHQ